VIDEKILERARAVTVAAHARLPGRARLLRRYNSEVRITKTDTC
jgi:hypothetical protein